jgi:hypothetical protein
MISNASTVSGKSSCGNKALDRFSREHRIAMAAIVFAARLNAHEVMNIEFRRVSDEQPGTAFDLSPLRACGPYLAG